MRAELKIERRNRRTIAKGRKGASLSFRNLCLITAALCLMLLAPAPAPAAWNVKNVLEDYIRENYPWAGVEISDVRLNNEPPADRPLSVVVEKTPPGRSVFRLDFPGGRSVTARAMVKAFDRVIVSRGSFNKGHVLRKDDVYSTVMESSRIPKGAVRYESRVIGKTLTRSVPANARLVDAMMSETAVVKRGRRVALCAEKTGLMVKTIGEIRDDASVGDYVKALNLLSKKIVTGRLVDENTVLVDF